MTFSLRITYRTLENAVTSCAGSAAGMREFNVLINGTQVLTNFDVFATAGGKDIAIVKSYTATASSSGTITV